MLLLIVEEVTAYWLIDIYKSLSTIKYQFLVQVLSLFDVLFWSNAGISASCDFFVVLSCCSYPGSGIIIKVGI